MSSALLAESIWQSHWLAQSAASAGVIVFAILLRWGLRRGVNSNHITSADLRRRWLLQVRNLTFLLITVALILIWATELKTAAISVVAIVVAIVLATKELILCLTGGLLKLSSRMFVLGDHIEVGPVRGDVIDQTLLTTKLLESSPGPNGNQFTGRTVTIPNATFLTQPVYNETLTKSFGLHVLTVPIKADAMWPQREAALLAALNEACAPFLDKARAAVHELVIEEGLVAPSVEPRVQIAIPEPGRVDLVARLPYPSDQKSRVVQLVLRSYLRKTEGMMQEDPESEGDVQY